MVFKYQVLVVSLLITSSLGQDVDVGHPQHFENDVDNSPSLGTTPHWRYEDQESWPKQYPMCGRSSQSPIDIDRRIIVDDKLTLEFRSYKSKMSKVQVLNDGHTVSFNFEGEKPSPRPTVTGSGTNGRNFLFAKGHFHWGLNNTIGSEHAINGRKFPVEMHLLHYNDRYKSLQEAMDKQDGLLAVAAFLQVSETDNPKLNSLFNLFNRVRCAGQSVNVTNAISLSSFLPNNLRDFYRYQGSLTTPPCNETVTWILLKQIVPIGQEQLKRLRELMSEDCKTPIGNNWRKLQKPNGRKVSRVSGCQGPHHG